jgi:chromosomal replication initiation ATPase DnaA
MKKESQINARIFNLVSELSWVDKKYHQRTKALQIELKCLKWVLSEIVTKTEVAYFIIRLVSDTLLGEGVNLIQVNRIRKSKQVQARRIAMHLIIQNTRFTIYDVAKIFRKDRATITYNIKTLTEQMKIYKNLAATVNELDQEVKRYITTLKDDSDDNCK